MSVCAVVGAQWGDEGKGKIVDLLATDADFVVRASGGGNTGRTVVNEFGEIVLHLIPAGIFNRNCVCIIGNGVMLDLLSDRGSIFNEFEMLKNIHVAVGPERLKISPRAHLVMPWHIWFDEAEEERRKDAKIGTTKRGIGPAMADKVARKGIRVGDLLGDTHDLCEALTSLYSDNARVLKEVYEKTPDMTIDELIAKVIRARDEITPYIADTQCILWNAIAKDARILLEGSQGVLLDLDLGIEYPFVTSTDVTPAGLARGAGIPITAIRRIIGVVKAFSTRVAPGPFPTEMPEDLAARFRELTGEFGATTGRPRRCGWLDGVQLRYAKNISGFTELAVTKFDSLSFLETVKICSAYRIGGKRYIYENSPSSFQDAEPAYMEWKGWGALPYRMTIDELPGSALNFLWQIRKMANTPITIVSIGPRREHTLYPSSTSILRE